VVGRLELYPGEHRHVRLQQLDIGPKVRVQRAQACRSDLFDLAVREPKPAILDVLLLAIGPDLAEQITAVAKR
jgi:hypothetical protein